MANNTQQLVKKSREILGYENVFPKTFTEAIKDKSSGQSLEEILNSYNQYYLSYTGSATSTRTQIPMSLRRKGLWITYVNYKDQIVTEWYGSDNLEDAQFGLDSNWRQGSNILVGDVSISSEGNWVINGVDSGFKAQGEKGASALLRYLNLTLQVSYDTGITWTTLTTFENKLFIKEYVATVSALPANATQGDIYGVGPTYAPEDTGHTNPIYRLYVRNNSAWVDNGLFTSISAGVVQNIGNSTSEIMSLNAVSSIVGLNEYAVFSANAFFPKGTIVNYNGILYLFMKDHPVGQWVEGDVKEYDLVNCVTDLGVEANLGAGQIITSYRYGYGYPLVNVGEIYDLTNKPQKELNNVCVEIDVFKGDKFTLEGYGGNLFRAWIVLDPNNKVLETSSSFADYRTNSYELNIENDGKLLINFNLNYKYSVTFKGIRGIVNTLLTWYEDLNGGIIEYKNFNANGYLYRTNLNVGTILELENGVPKLTYDNPSSRSTIIPCDEGSKFSVNGKGGISFLYWCFVDESYVIISKSDISASGEVSLVAPRNGYLLINFLEYNGDTYFIKEDKENVIATLLQQVSELYKTVFGEDKEYIGFLQGKAIATNVGIGNKVDITPYNDSCKCAVIPCTANLLFSISGSGAATARLWCFTDSNYICNSVATEGLAIEGALLEAPEDGFLIVNLQNYSVNPYLKFITKPLKLEIIEEITNPTIPECESYPIIEPVNMPTTLLTPNNRSQVARKHTYSLFLTTFYDIYVDKRDLALNGYVVKKTALGKDQSGNYDIYEYDFIPKNYSRIVLLSAGMNACETGGIYGLSLFMRDIVNPPEGDNAMVFLHNNVRFKVIPVICPSSFDTEFLEYGNYRGVNINRNFNYDNSWELMESSPGSWNYKGVAPDSEAETKVIKKWILDNGKSSTLWLDCHLDIGGSRQKEQGAVWNASCCGVQPYISTEWGKLKTWYSQTKGLSLGYSTSNINDLLAYPKTVFSYEVCECPAMMIEQWPSLGYQYGSSGLNGAANEGVNCDAAGLLNYILLIRETIIGVLQKPLPERTTDELLLMLYLSRMENVSK